MYQPGFEVYITLYISILGNDMTISSHDRLLKAPRIRLHLNVHEPIELVEMTLAFQGLGYEYQSYIRNITLPNNAKGDTKDVKLFITKIESNCILAEMAPALPLFGSLAPIFTDANTVADFVKNISDLINWLRNLSTKSEVMADEIPHSKRRLNNVRDIVRLVGNAKDSNLGLKAIRYVEETNEDKVLLEMDFSDAACREAERGAVMAIQALESREKADKEKVLMYFYQTNTDDPKSSGKTGDKALIESISPDPLSVYVIPETDQQKIRWVLDDKDHNPLHTGFVVDVNIENDRKGKPRIYRVLKVHEVIYDESKR